MDVPFPFCPIYHPFPSGFTGPFTFVHVMERFLFPIAYVQESEGQFMRLTLTDPSILKPRIYSTYKINPLPDHSVVFIGRSFSSACSARFDLPQLSIGVLSCIFTIIITFCNRIKKRLRHCLRQKILNHINYVFSLRYTKLTNQSFKSSKFNTII